MNKIKHPTYTEICDTLDHHWLSGNVIERINSLISQLEFAMDGQHPMQKARNLTLQKINKHWENAPEWANYLTENENGQCTFHELRPGAGICAWVSNGKTLDVGDSGKSWRDKFFVKPEN